MCGKKNDFNFDEKLERIVGGTEATIHEYPWQALVRCLVKTMYITCGGSVIADEWILTAAHCLEGFDILICALKFFF